MAVDPHDALALHALLDEADGAIEGAGDGIVDEDVEPEAVAGRFRKGPIRERDEEGAAGPLAGGRDRDALERDISVTIGQATQDGRNNYNDANTGALASIQRKAGRVLWMNPEPPGAWGFGDSAMRLYEPYTTRVMTVHNLQTLRDAVDALVE